MYGVDVIDMCIRFLLFLLFLTVPVWSSFVRCEHRSSFFPIRDLYADPPNAVAANQEVNLRIDVRVPNNAYLVGVHSVLTTQLNGVSLYSQTDEFPILADAPEQSFVRTFRFPTHIWGRFRADLTVYNASGTSLLCVRWSVFATNTAKNDTSRWFMK